LHLQTSGRVEILRQLVAGGFELLVPRLLEPVVDLALMSRD
jgi:hypothetical protein